MTDSCLEQTPKWAGGKPIFAASAKLWIDHEETSLETFALCK